LVDIKKVAEKIYLIDDLLYSLPKWGSIYLIDEEKKALIDTGPSTSAGVVLDGIKEIGVKAEEIDYLIVTHIYPYPSGPRRGCRNPSQGDAESAGISPPAWSQASGKSGEAGQ